MSNSSSPPPKDLIVMTRLNTVGLRRLAEGTLVEKKPFESRPPSPPRLSEPPRMFTPEPARSSEPPRVPAPPPAANIASAVSRSSATRAPLETDSMIETLSVDDELGADAAEDRTLALGADAADDRTVAAPIRTPAPAPTFASRAGPASGAVPVHAGEHRVDMETPTALFVKDIQRTLQEELAKHDKHDSNRAARMDAVTAPPPAVPSNFSLADTVLGLKPTNANARVEPTFELKFEPTPAKTASVPAPPRSKPSSLTPPAKANGSSLPAPLHAQASRRKDPVAVSVSTRPARIERKGGFLPWAAALTALGVFVGIAGARIATGAPFLHAAAPVGAAPVPLAMAEPGFAPHVAVPAAAPVEKAFDQVPVPVPVAVAKAAEPVKVEEKAAPAPEVIAAKPEEKAEAKVEKAEAKAKVEPKWQPAPRAERPRAPRPAPVEKAVEEKVAKVEKPEPAPAPVAAKPKPEAPVVPPKGSKSPDVAAAARDYAAVQSQLGDSL